MGPVHLDELLPEVQELHYAGKSTRTESFLTLRSLSNSLAAIGLPLSVFTKDPELNVGPLGALESRQWNKKLQAFFVHNAATEQAVPELPASFRASAMPILVSISDQGPLNVPALDMLSYKLRAHVIVAWDPYHRAWNDLKDSLRKTGLFRTFLELAVVFNINYGPSGTGKWFERKAATLRQLLATSSPHAEPFLSFLPMIAKERRIAEPCTAEQRDAVWRDFAVMETVRQKGPLMKLMRWFSFWDCNRFYRGEIWFSKVLLSGGDINAADDRGSSPLRLDTTGSLSAKDQLRELKMRHGTWAVARSLITPASYWRNELIYALGRPVWSAFSKRAADVKTPQEAWMSQGKNHLMSRVAYTGLP